MSQNYQSQDLWSRATSVNGYAFDELRSVLQKSIRRGLVEEAVLAAYEFFLSGAEAEEALWRRARNHRHGRRRLWTGRGSRDS